MNIEEISNELEGALMADLGNGFNVIPSFVVEDLLEAWEMYLGPTEFKNRIRLLKAGHAVPSPVCPEHEYRIGGIVGRQQSLPGIT